MMYTSYICVSQIIQHVRCYFTLHIAVTFTIARCWILYWWTHPHVDRPGGTLHLTALLSALTRYSECWIDKGVDLHKTFSQFDWDSILWEANHMHTWLLIKSGFSHSDKLRVGIPPLCCIHIRFKWKVRITSCKWLFKRYPAIWVFRHRCDCQTDEYLCTFRWDCGHSCGGSCTGGSGQWQSPTVTWSIPDKSADCWRPCCGEHCLAVENKNLSFNTCLCSSRIALYLL